MFVIRAFAAGSGISAAKAIPSMLTATFILAALVVLVVTDESPSAES